MQNKGNEGWYDQTNSFENTPLWTGGGCWVIGSKSSLSKPDELFFDLKNFLGLATSEPDEITEADLIDVKDAEPHFPTTPADFEAETPGIRMKNR